MFRSIASRFKSLLTHTFPTRPAEKMVSHFDVSVSTRVETKAASLQKRQGLPIVEAVAANTTKVEGKKRFRRTRNEIRLGLTAERAQTIRATEAQERKARHGKRGKDKAPRTKRTQIIERKPVVAKPTDLIETLEPKIQARARAVSRYRSTGGKGVVTTEMLDQIAQRVATGQVTKCPPCTDSDGYNHLTGQEPK